MSSDIPSIEDLELEALLGQLQPLGPDADLLERLTAAAEGTATDLTDSELAEEVFLRQVRPAGLSDAFSARLRAVVAETPFVLDEKIVLFPKAGVVVQRASRLPKIAVAAAIAVLGAAAALLVPQDGLVDENNPPSVAGERQASTAPSEFVPANFNRGLSQALDQGVLWEEVGSPHRVVRVDYLDRATFVNGEGKTVEIEQPKVEYILIPEEID